MSIEMTPLENQLYAALKSCEQFLTEIAGGKEEGYGVSIPLKEARPAMKAYEDEAKRREIADKCETNHKLYGA